MKLRICNNCQNVEKYCLRKSIDFGNSDYIKKNRYFIRSIKYYMHFGREKLKKTFQ